MDFGVLHWTALFLEKGKIAKNLWVVMVYSTSAEY